MPKILSPSQRRLNMIRQRAMFVEHLATMPDEATLTRDPDEHDIAEQQRRGRAVGALWVARQRGL